MEEEHDKTPGENDGPSYFDLSEATMKLILLLESWKCDPVMSQKPASEIKNKLMKRKEYALVREGDYRHVRLAQEVLFDIIEADFTADEPMPAAAYHEHYFGPFLASASASASASAASSKSASVKSAVIDEAAVKSASDQKDTGSGMRLANTPSAEGQAPASGRVALPLVKKLRGYGFLPESRIPDPYGVGGYHGQEGDRVRVKFYNSAPHSEEYGRLTVAQQNGLEDMIKAHISATTDGKVTGFLPTIAKEDAIVVDVVYNIRSLKGKTGSAKGIGENTVSAAAASPAVPQTRCHPDAGGAEVTHQTVSTNQEITDEEALAHVDQLYLAWAIAESLGMTVGQSGDLVKMEDDQDDDIQSAMMMSIVSRQEELKQLKLTANPYGDETDDEDDEQPIQKAGKRCDEEAQETESSGKKLRIAGETFSPKKDPPAATFTAAAAAAAADDDTASASVAVDESAVEMVGVEATISADPVTDMAAVVSASAEPVDDSLPQVDPVTAAAAAGDGDGGDADDIDPGEVGVPDKQEEADEVNDEVTDAVTMRHRHHQIRVQYYRLIDGSGEPDSDDDDFIAE